VTEATGGPQQGGEDVARKFEAAWRVFTDTCRLTLVNEATYQVWFAHYLISQFGIDRVIREPDFGPRYFATRQPDAFEGDSLRLDVVVSREPGLDVPHRAHRPRVSDQHGGIALLGDLAVISELKVSATQGDGLSYEEVTRDFQKLALLLDEAGHHGIEQPLAYACILDNGKGKSGKRGEPSFNWEYFYNRHLTRVFPDGVGDRIAVLGGPPGFNPPGWFTGHAGPGTGG